MDWETRQRIWTGQFAVLFSRLIDSNTREHAIHLMTVESVGRNIFHRITLLLEFSRFDPLCRIGRITFVSRFSGSIVGKASSGKN